MRLKATWGVAALLLLAGCTGSGTETDGDEPASSQNRTCRGSLGAEEVDGDLVVPRDATCRLDGTIVRGRTTVGIGATLIARQARLQEGVGAHWFERVELRDVSAPDSRITDFVFDGGGDLVIRGGPYNGRYWVVRNTGRIEITGFPLDIGSIYCAGNRRPPVVRGISAESPGVLQGQCAGLKHFGVSDF